MSQFLDLLRTTAVGPALVLMLVIGGGSSARAAGADESLSPPVRSTLGITAGLGFRSDLVHSAGLDAFSGTDAIAQSVLSLSYRLVGTELSGLAAGFEWNHGSTAALARSANASLTIDRLTVPIEARFRVGKRLAAFARVAPGVLRDRAVILDGSAPGAPYDAIYATGQLQQTSWQLAADISGGLAFHFAEIRTGGPATFGFWLTAEAGYGYAGTHDLVLNGRTETQPSRIDEPLRLGTLALGGPFLRARLALSF